MNCVTLRIKKKYYDLIKDGIKKIEYRDYKPYYTKRFSKKVNFLRLHYQQRQNLIVKCRKIVLIKTPSFDDKTIPFSEFCYAIHLGGVLKEFKS